MLKNKSKPGAPDALRQSWTPAINRALNVDSPPICLPCNGLECLGSWCVGCFSFSEVENAGVHIDAGHACIPGELFLRQFEGLLQMPVLDLAANCYHGQSNHDLPSMLGDY